ncbi:MAG: hypothetical protein A2W18_07095 [Candidatus Muproteobacteria bacterium RBG_16_60_9]|uniref:Major facilitator superfamily (MFS) profile domain-containing protein n=1 Tax=Candidatus Muproteobacteria bacterium RBG_16_60_9 TaxID=1817755 RepID=A0A1F6VI18_9PROT|nr:MAG: hypothetical protein A2W18_07095 [Candidatus Muproteobacteria bacterium RBG_16_60_9]
MSGIYGVLRVFVGFFGFIALGGIIWFASSLASAIALAGVLLGLTSLVAAFIPQRKLSSGKTRRTLVTLCVVGAGAGLVLVADNFSASGGIEWDVVAINVLHVAALATMAVIALRRPPAST